MPVTDPIADMLTRIRNAVRNRQESVRVLRSKVVVAVAETLKAEGFIGSFEEVQVPVHPRQAELLIHLRYGPAGEPVINRLERVSKPGCRRYSPVEDLKPVLRGLGIRVLSTPKGVLSDRQARQANVGGEVLCIVE